MTVLDHPRAVTRESAAAARHTSGVRVPVRNRWTALTRRPRASTAVTVMIAVTLSVFPSYLPHDPITQGVMTTLITALLVLLVRRMRSRTATLTGPAHRMIVAMCAAATLGALVTDQVVQDGMRSEIGMPSLGLAYWLTMAGTVCGLVLLGHIMRLAWRQRRKLWKPALVLALMVAIFSPISPVHAESQLSVPTASSDRPLEAHSPVGAVRAWAEEQPGEGVQDRATRATDQLVADGGLTRSRVIIVMPTGSGWVDPDFVRGVEQRFGRDVAIVGMQYDDLPSWMSYLLHKDDAENAARALFAAVSTRVDALPPSQRPDLDVYGESLGATAGQAIFTGPGSSAARREVCAVLWVGTPGGHRVGLPHESLVSNADDPVVHTHPSDIWSRPDPSRAWLPLISYAQTGADLVDALLVPEGSGHNYGPSQADALQTCR